MTYDETRQIEVAQVDRNARLTELDTPAEFTCSVPDLPLHRRFRLWLPLLGAFAAAVSLSALPPFFRGGDWLAEFLAGPNFTISLLDKALAALVPAVSSPVCGTALLLGFWYIVGLGLDSLRSGEARRLSRAPSWIWILLLLSFGEFIRTTAIGLSFSRWYFNVIDQLAIGPLYQRAHLPLFVRINYWAIAYGAPLVWGSAWAVVLVQLGSFIRARRIAGRVGSFSPSSFDDQSAGFLKSRRYSHLRPAAAAVVAMAALGYIAYSASINMVREARDLLSLICALALAVVYLKWLFPEFRFLRAFREQIAWRNLRCHLMFIGAALAICISWGFADFYLGGLESRLYAQSKSAVITDPSSVMVISILLQTIRVAVPFLLLLAFKLFYGTRWRNPHRHFIFAAIVLTIWGLAQLADAYLAAVHSGYRARDAIWNTLPFLLFLLFAVSYRQWLFSDFRSYRFGTKGAWRWFVSRKPSHYLAFAITLFLLICIFLQNRDLFWKTLIYGLLLLFLRLIVPKTSRYRWMLYGGVLAGLVLTAVGSYNPERDLFLILIGFVISYGYWLAAEKQGWKHTQGTSAAMLFFSVWTLCSVGDALPPDMTFATSHATFSREYFPERFAELKQHYPGKRVGLALSGGGYRAALMQAGVLQGFEELKIPVTNISAVSGGSITGAYYSLGGMPRGVLNAILFRQFNTPRDFFDIQNAVRMISSTPFPGTHVRLLPGYSFGRTDVQAQALDRVLLHDRKFRDVPSGAPNLMICVTDLDSGSALGLTSHWRITRFMLRPPGEDLFPNVRSLYGDHPRVSIASSFAPLDSEDTKLSRAVAASGAFPLAFEPVRLTGQHTESFLMADGGVSDNSGMTLLLEADRTASLESAPQDKLQGNKDWALDVAVSVDGGAMFQHNSADADTTSMDVAGRAVDLIHSRLGATKPSEARGPGRPSGPGMVLLSPALYMDNSRNYDYKRIGMHFDVEADSRLAWNFDDSRRSKNALSTQQFSEEQQQLLELLTTQTTNMDRESLQLLRRLEGADPRFYGHVLDALNANWLTEEERRILLEGHADQPKLEAINNKRRRRANALGWTTLLIAQDFSKCLQTFVNTPTLDDNISEIDAKRLFRLGQYLVLLNAHEIRKRLTDGAASTNDAGSTSAEKAAVLCTLEAVGKYGQSSTSYKDNAEYQQHREAANAEVHSCIQQLAKENPQLKTDVVRIGWEFPF
jgi:predicted acylesterase/phospholipase RssA